MIRRRRLRPYTLQQAASIVFALIAVLPLLIFTWALCALDAIPRFQAQLSLALALLVALLGFAVFRALMGRMSELIQAMAHAVKPPSGSQAAERAGMTVPGIGAVQEFGEIARTIALLWKAEATPHAGRRVLVSVRNSPEPLAGTLVQVTDDGVLLDQGGRQVGVSYRRISAIEADRASP